MTNTEMTNTEMTITNITLRDCDGEFYSAPFRAICAKSDALIGVATLSADGENFRVPSVVYEDGTVISATDWQGAYLDDDQIVDEASDPTWAHHWVGPEGEPVVIVDGLPRLIG